jgi:hypothetical protein
MPMFLCPWKPDRSFGNVEWRLSADESAIDANRLVPKSLPLKGANERTKLSYLAQIFPRRPETLNSRLLDPLPKPKEEYQMPLMQLVITLIAVGVLLWLVNRFIPMQSSIKSILNGVVVIIVVVWLANLFGLFAPLSRIHVGR